MFPPDVHASRFNAFLRRLRLLGVLVAVVQGMSACATLPPPPAHAPVHAIADPQSTSLGKRVAAAQPQPGLSGLGLSISGSDALATLMTLADQAERTLDLQYYLVHNEPSTRALLRHVRAAADRGVRVRLLVDDLNTAENDAAFRRLTEHPKIEVRLYNPLPSGRFSTVTRLLSSFTDMDRVNRRMHNKVFIADNAIAFTGGRNLGDAYFLASDKANFVDIDVVVAGPAVRALSKVFDRYWNSPLAFPVHRLVPESEAAASAADPRQLDNAPPADPTFGLAPDALARQLVAGGGLKLTWARARLLADDPAKIEAAGEVGPDQLMFDDVASLMRSARQELVVISPYLVPGKRGLELIGELRRRGLAVRVLTSGLASTDAPAVHIGYSRYRVPLLKQGVQLWEMRTRVDDARLSGSGFGRSAARLHAKVVVVDRRWLLVGSMNLDPRSIELNSEQGLLINSPALAAEVLRFFDEMTRYGSYRVELDGDGKLRWVGDKPGGAADEARSEPDTSFWRRFGWRLLSPFAPEEML
jgi:phosphatidylserine/phosphatidylglycerophosphate/cardiolipin synthase-like enzyme